MLQVQLICVGKLKERFYAEACAEYQKRLQGLCKLQLIELPEQSGPDGLVREAQAILRAAAKGAHLIAWCIEGEAVSSEDLADKLARWGGTGDSRLCFVIGSSEGLDAAFKAAAHSRLSMSKMTFPHHLARVMVLEQIYRALSILQGGKYHK